MKKILLCLILLFPALGMAQSDISSENCLKAISIFKEDPLSQKADRALSYVFIFADKSPDVLVGVKVDYFPWNEEVTPSKVKNKLLGAYIAGNVEFQLQHNVNADHPYQGVLLMLDTYIKMKTAGEVEPMPGLEEWLKLKADKKLESKILKIQQTESDDGTLKST